MNEHVYNGSVADKLAISDYYIHEKNINPYKKYSSDWELYEKRMREIYKKWRDEQ